MHSAIAGWGVNGCLDISAIGGRLRAAKLSAAMRGALTLVALAALVFVSAHAGAQTETALYSFTGTPDGANPYYSTLVRDSAGDLYGTTLNGGANGLGSVFELTATGTEKVLYSFAGSPDGANPYAGLVMDKNGNLYGTTAAGGADSYGTVFELTATGTEKVLYSFAGPPDGANPYKALVLSKKSTLYGTTFNGGADGYGTVFSVTEKGVEKVLYSFTGGADGARPSAGVILDKKGNLYGTVTGGGDYGGGTVYELNPSLGTLSVLYAFTGGADGYEPYTPLIFDKKGNLYGTTAGGGAGCGTVYELLAPSWTTENVLHTFDYSDGCYADSGVVFGKKNNLYGTTYWGGASGQGVVYELTASGAFNDLHSFAGGADGAQPLSALVVDKQGYLYGTTTLGGSSGDGTVFKVVP